MNVSGERTKLCPVEFRAEVIREFACPRLRCRRRSGGSVEGRLGHFGTPEGEPSRWTFTTGQIVEEFVQPLSLVIHELCPSVPLSEGGNDEPRLKQIKMVSAEGIEPSTY